MFDNRIHNGFLSGLNKKKKMQIEDEAIDTSKDEEIRNLKSNLEKINLIIAKVAQSDSETLKSSNYVNDVMCDCNSNEEFEEFSDNFSKFLNNIKYILQDQETSHSREYERRNIDLQERNSLSVKNTSKKLQILKDQANETNENVEFISTIFSEMVNVSQALSIQVANASDVTKETSENANSIKDVIEKLKHGYMEIGNVVEMINKITKQTNLLALNATIEAARAGEAGRGFGVVANAVKAMANETDNATKTIKDNIEGIQDQSKQAIDTILGLLKNIDIIFEKFSDISSSVEGEVVMTNEIERVMGSTIEGLREITQGINAVEDI